MACFVIQPFPDKFVVQIPIPIRPPPQMHMLFPTIIRNSPRSPSFLPSEDDIFPHSLNCAFRYTVIGRLMIGEDQEATSYDACDLCESFHFECGLNPTSTWRLISLGDGYYSVQFTCSADFVKISSMQFLPSKYGTLLLIPERSPDFNALKSLTSSTHNSVTIVRWRPPPPFWIKVNTDGSARGCPGPSSSGGVFRDSRGVVMGCFSLKLEPGYALEAELSACISAILIAKDKGWRRIWLESDSTQVVELLASRSGKVPKKVKKMWMQVLSFLEEMEFRVSHIYREGNKVADALASPEAEKGWWPSATPAIQDMVYRDAIGCVSARTRE